MKRFFLLGFISITSLINLRAASGDSIWAVNFIHDIYLNFTQNDFYDSLINTHTTDTYMKCDMIFDGRTLPSVGAKFKGNSSFNNPSIKKSMKLDLNYYISGQNIDKIKKINLNNGFKDPSFLREKLALDFMNAHGVAAPRCTYARVYLNNTYWGLYTLVEDVDSKFLKQHYPDNNGNLYKGDPAGDLKWYGSAASSYYSHYELSSSSTVIDWSDLVHFLDIANNTSSTVYYDSLETVLDSWSFLYYLAAQNIFVNLDSYAGSGHNYYTFDDSTYFHFHWIAWDVNESFGNFQMNMNLSQLENLNYDYLSQPANRPLAEKMLADATYHQMYISAFCNMMPDFTNAKLDPKIDSLANLIRADVYADPNKFFTNQQFEDNITMNVGNTAGIKSFITARATSLSSQLQPYGCWTGVTENNPAPETFAIFPNPSSSSAAITIPSAWNMADCELRVFDATGKDISTENLISSSNNSYVLSTVTMANGIYFVTLTNSAGERMESRLSVMH
ncbi:MAG TPA: CotH kinase family protein [Bacteroidia bacterium]|nr:CotH kinase family protein [Bacteroidia bacterium]